MLPYAYAMPAGLHPSSMRLLFDPDAVMVPRVCSTSTVNVPEIKI
jgi:hypothetical protein